jgi:hypothetical protein
MNKLIHSLFMTAAFYCVGTNLALAQVTNPNSPVPTGASQSRPVQAGAPAPLPVPAPVKVVIPELTITEVSQIMQARFLNIPGVRRVGPLADSPNVLRLISHNDMSVRLDNLLTRVNAQGADREAEYTRFENNVRSLLSRTDPFKLDQLRVVIRKTAAINAFETESGSDGMTNPVVRRPFMADLEEVVVGDTPTAIALMPAARLTDLQMSATQAFERGRANTLSNATGVTWNVVNGLNHVSVISGYETSLLALDSVWTAIATRIGGPVAIIVPTREKLIIGRADRPRDIAKLRALALGESTGERALSNKVWVRRGQAWVER